MKLPQKGDRIRLLDMPNDPCPIPPGTTGTVVSVTVFSPMPMSHSVWENGRPVQTQLPAPDATAQISVDWDIPRSLSLTLPEDTFEVIDDE